MHSLTSVQPVEVREVARAIVSAVEGMTSPDEFHTARLPGHVVEIEPLCEGSGQSLACVYRRSGAYEFMGSAIIDQKDIAS